MKKLITALFASLLCFAAFPFIRRLFSDMNYPPLNGTVRLIYLGFFALSFGLFLMLLLKENREPTEVISIQKKMMFAGALALVFLFVYPVFSIDLPCYIMQGRVMSIHNANPYLVAPDNFPNDPFVQGIFWTHRVAFYGPAWILISAAATFVAGNGVLTNLVLMKLPIMAGYLLLVWQIYLLGGKICPGKKAQAASFIAFNPFIITQYLVDGHQDVLMLGLAVWAINRVLDRKYMQGYFLLAVSILIKYMSAMIAPFLAFIVYNQLENKKDIIKHTILFITISLVTALLAYFPFLSGGAGFFKNFMAHKLFLGTKGLDTNTIPYFMLLAGEKLRLIRGINIVKPAAWIINIFHMLFSLSGILIILKAWKDRAVTTKVLSCIALMFISYFIFEAFSFGAWFLIWLIPFLIVSDIKNSLSLAYMISVAAAVSFWKRLSFLLIGACCVYGVILIIKSKNIKVN